MYSPEDLQFKAKQSYLILDYSKIKTLSMERGRKWQLNFFERKTFPNLFYLYYCEIPANKFTFPNLIELEFSCYFNDSVELLVYAQ